MATDTPAERRTKLRRVQALVQELISINEMVARIETQLETNSISGTEVSYTADKLLDGCGPPTKGSAAALDVCTGDKITDRIINILNDVGGSSDSIDWSHPTT